MRHPIALSGAIIGLVLVLVGWSLYRSAHAEPSTNEATVTVLPSISKASSQPAPLHPPVQTTPQLPPRPPDLPNADPAPHRLLPPLPLDFRRELASLSESRHVWIEQFPDAPALPTDPALWLNVESSAIPTWENLSGKVVLLMFTSTSCVPCQKILPEIKKIGEKFGTDLTVILIYHSGEIGYKPGWEEIVRSKVEELTEKIKESDISFPILVDAGHQINQAYIPDSYPDFFIVQDGIVIIPDCRHDVLEPSISALLNE